MTRMRRGQIALRGAVAVIAATVFLNPTLAAGQAGQLAAPKEVATRTETAPRTSWGDPDLRGTWTNTTLTPFERSDDQAAAARPRDESSGRYDPNVSSVGAYNEFWTDRADLARDNQGTSSQTALVVDPPDGKLPALTPPARKYADELEALRRPERPASWVELNPYDRCITRGLPGGMIPGFYNHNYQFLQTPDHVAILVEMIHEARIIPLDRRPHLGSDIRQWTGNSRGRWEGETLVVETTDFNDKIREYTGNAQRLPNGEPVSRYHASLGTPTLRLVERFTPIDEHTMDYRFTVTDPVTFMRPWTVAAPMVKIEGPLYEYACHEGNYGLRNMLRVARAQEQVEALGK